MSASKRLNKVQRKAILTARRNSKKEGFDNHAESKNLRKLRQSVKGGR